ncbi:MAG TPA: isoprenylcysteine carboxylmethyltransferase family protein [Steroidobacteraceae bacterium]|nr:isoprenylcysteine carboxylmethyltransferase family protein [Steroidobacteraceae bacterium]
MRALENKIPPPIVVIVCALLMWGIARATPGIAIDLSIRIFAACALVLLGGVFCVSGIISFRVAKTTVNPLKPETATSLVSSGVFRISRNPMYVGFAFFLLAWAAFLAAPWALFGVLGFVLYMIYFQIAPEEQALAALFGPEYAAYQAKVRRWL